MLHLPAGLIIAVVLSSASAFVHPHTRRKGSVMVWQEGECFSSSNNQREETKFSLCFACGEHRLAIHQCDQILVLKSFTHGTIVLTNGEQCNERNLEKKTETV